MNKAEFLSHVRMGALTRSLPQDQLPASREAVIPVIGKETEAVALNYNFDTFSFMFDLIDYAKDKDTSLSDAFVGYRVNTPMITAKYNGSNCTGLSIELRSRLAGLGVPTYLAPCYGRYLLTPGADDYGQIRTIDLVGLLEGKEKEWFFLAPGLTIDKPLHVRDGSRVESFGSTHLISGVNDSGFELVSVKPNGNKLSRNFAFQEVFNPDASVQKNLLRARTRYQMTRQYKNGSRDFITFDFPQRKFRVSIRGEELVLDIEGFRNYVLSNSLPLEARFRNSMLSQGFIDFIDNIDNISQELLLPDIQAALAQI